MGPSSLLRIPPEPRSIRSSPRFSQTISESSPPSSVSQLTYTRNQKNNGDLLSLAYVRMPNISIYEQDKDGNDLPEFYHMQPTLSSALRDQMISNNKNIPNPVALAYQAKNNETSYNIDPEFKLKPK